MLYSGESGYLEFERHWNASTTKESNRMIAGAVAIWEDDPDLTRLQHLFESARQTGVSLESTECVEGLLTIARAVSRKFWNVIESLQMEGVEKRELMHESKDPSTGLYQLIIKDSAPELHQTAKIEKLRICERCGEPMEVYRL